MVKTLTELAGQNGNGRILAVSHGGACFNFLRGIEADMGLLRKGITNCCIFVLAYDEGKFVITDYIPNPI